MSVAHVIKSTSDAAPCFDQPSHSFAEFRSLLSSVAVETVGALDVLSGWCASHELTLNECLVEPAPPLPQNHSARNIHHGSPLYVACVFNCDVAVNVLLQVCNTCYRDIHRK